MPSISTQWHAMLAGLCIQHPDLICHDATTPLRAPWRRWFPERSRVHKRISKRSAIAHHWLALRLRKNRGVERGAAMRPRRHRHRNPHRAKAAQLQSRRMACRSSLTIARIRCGCQVENHAALLNHLPSGESPATLAPVVTGLPAIHQRVAPSLSLPVRSLRFRRATGAGDGVDATLHLGRTAWLY